MTPRRRNAARSISGRRLESVGAKARTRTADRTIFSRELYQLSYLGMLKPPSDRWAIEGSNL